MQGCSQKRSSLGFDILYLLEHNSIKFRSSIKIGFVYGNSLPETMLPIVRSAGVITGQAECPNSWTSLVARPLLRRASIAASESSLFPSEMYESAQHASVNT